MRNSCRNCCGCSCQNNNDNNECPLEDVCDNVCPVMPDMNNNNSCNCGFDEEDNGFPMNPMYAQSYVPIQRLKNTFTPEVGLKMGTIFPELVSPYMPNQSIEEIEYIKSRNCIGEGCNK